MLIIVLFLLSPLVFLLFVLSDSAPATQPEVTVTGDWQVQVKAGDATVTLAVPPAELITVTAEKYADLPLFDDGAAGWGRARSCVG